MALARVNVSSGGRTPPVIVNVPTQSGTLTYSGSVKTPTWSDYDSTQLVIGGTTSATNAGTYTATFTPQAGVTWVDGTSSPKSATWTIGKAAANLTALSSSVSVDAGKSTSFAVTTDSDGTLTVTSSNTSVATATISGKTITVSGVGSGTATIMVAQAASANYNAATTVSCSATVSKVTPTLTLSKSSASLGVDDATTFTITTNSDGALSVSSSSTTVASVSLNGKTVTITGVGAGDAIITVTQAATNGYNSATATCNVSVAKAIPTLTLSATSGTVVKDKTLKFTITTNSTGTLTVSSSATSKATATISGKTVTVTGVSAGTATITVSLATTDVYAAKTATYSVSVSAFQTITDSWATISTRAITGTAANYYNVGDCKEITLNGKIGDCLTLNNKKLYVFILHINYPMNGTPDNNIIWGGFKTEDGTDVALVDSKYDGDVSFSLDGTICFNLNHTGNNVTNTSTGGGGWKGTDFRYDILGATSQAPPEYNQADRKSSTNVGYDATAETLQNPKANTLLAALPQEFRNRLRLWHRWIDSVGAHKYATEISSTDVKETIDAVTLLTEFEVTGERFLANDYEKNHQTQMDYFKNGNSKIKYSHQNTSLAVDWWNSSPYRGDEMEYYTIGTIAAPSCFCAVKATGNNSIFKGVSSLGIAPAFKT